MSNKLVYRLRNPRWDRDERLNGICCFNVEQAIADMKEAANLIEQLMAKKNTVFTLGGGKKFQRSQSFPHGK